MNAHRLLLGRAVFAILAALFLTYLFGRTITRDLNHDEHQFLAPAALLSRQGLLPYVDYPIFHLPNSVIVYAALDQLTSEILLSAKLFSLLSTVGVGVIIVWAASRRSPTFGDWAGVAAVACVLCLLGSDPLFDFTIGKTWNHEFPTFCLLLGVVLVSVNFTRNKMWIALLIGAIAGLATGFRLTFIFTVVPLCLAPLLYAIPWRRRFALITASSLAFLIAMSPSFWFWAKAPEAFIFDNFQFPRLRLLDEADERVRKTMSLWRKVRFFLKEVLLPSWPLAVAYITIGFAPALRWIRDKSPTHFPSAFLLICIPCLLAGCFVPSRYQYQHFYALIPLLGLGIAFGFSAMGEANIRKGLAIAAALALAGLGMCAASPERSYGWIPEIVQPRKWYRTESKLKAAQLRTFVSRGKVLTLAPALVAEAGLEIYPAFATGPFGWRASKFIDRAQRVRLGFIAEDDLVAYLENDPPAAILTGYGKKGMDAPFVNFAESHAYEPINLDKKRVLWMPPTAPISERTARPGSP